MINKNRKIILIGGAPTVGKSTMAGLLAEHLKVPWISTDQLRALMRIVADRNKLPKLFEPEGYDAERFLTEFSAREIVNREFEQAEATWPAIQMFVNEDYTWDNGFIIEGIAILPHLVAKDFGQNQNIKTIFLVDEDADRIRDVVFHRGLWDDADKYPDSVKEKEIDWALLFSHELKTEAEKFGYPCVEVSKNKDDLRTLLKCLEIS